MYNYKKSLFAALLILTTLLSCGDDSSTYANQKTVENLSALMSSHPEFSKANLKQIKDAAQGTSNTKSPSHYTALYAQENKLLAANDKASSVLDSMIAVKAQDLIEDSIKNFDFMASFDASIKMAGIAINMQNEMMDKMKDYASKNFGGKGDIPNKFDGDFSGKTMTCEDLVNNPFVEMGRDELDAVMAENKEQMLETISGCPELKGGEFVRCMADLNKYMSLVNEHANCSIKNMRELKNIVREKSGVDLNSLELDINRCMKKQFKSCGYQEQRARNKSNNQNEKSFGEDLSDADYYEEHHEEYHGSSSTTIVTRRD
jgi:hypothetical protein